jgi:hypothetical protein
MVTFENNNPKCPKCDLPCSDAYRCKFCHCNMHWFCGTDGSDGSELGHGAHYVCVNCANKKIPATSNNEREVNRRTNRKALGHTSNKQKFSSDISVATKKRNVAAKVFEKCPPHSNAVFGTKRKAVGAISNKKKAHPDTCDAIKKCNVAAKASKKRGASSNAVSTKIRKAVGPISKKKKPAKVSKKQPPSSNAKKQKSSSASSAAPRKRKSAHGSKKKVKHLHLILLLLTLMVIQLLQLFIGQLIFLKKLSVLVQGIFLSRPYP